jgi:hypothetical protein
MTTTLILRDEIGSFGFRQGKLGNLQWLEETQDSNFRRGELGYRNEWTGPPRDVVWMPPQTLISSYDGRADLENGHEGSAPCYLV